MILMAPDSHGHNQQQTMEQNPYHSPPPTLKARSYASITSNPTVFAAWSACAMVLIFYSERKLQNLNLDALHESIDYRPNKFLLVIPSHSQQNDGYSKIYLRIFNR